MFDKVLDKLGLYDLIGVLLPGVIACAVSLVVDEALLRVGLSRYLNADDLFIFLLMGYLIGVILQELGSLAMKFLDKGERMLHKALEPLDNARTHISREEWNLIESSVAARLCKEKPISKNLLYNHCKNAGGNNTQADKDQSIAAMSRSLAVYFALLAALLTGYSLAAKEFYIIVLACVSLSLMLLFWKRSERFYIIRYIRIVRAYYYQNQEQVKEEKENKRLNSSPGEKVS